MQRRRAKEQTSRVCYDTLFSPLKILVITCGAEPKTVSLKASCLPGFFRQKKVASESIASLPSEAWHPCRYRDGLPTPSDLPKCRTANREAPVRLGLMFLHYLKAALGVASGLAESAL